MRIVAFLLALPALAAPIASTYSEANAPCVKSVVFFRDTPYIDTEIGSTSAQAFCPTLGMAEAQAEAWNMPGKLGAGVLDFNGHFDTAIAESTFQDSLVFNFVGLLRFTIMATLIGDDDGTDDAWAAASFNLGPPPSSKSIACLPSQPYCITHHYGSLPEVRIPQQWIVDVPFQPGQTVVYSVTANAATLGYGGSTEAFSDVMYSYEVFQSVPEPSAVVLVGLGLVILWVGVQWQGKKQSRFLRLGRYGGEGANPVL